MEAAIGFIGVIVGSSIVVIYQFLSERRLHIRRARYLAIAAVSILDEYMSNCDDILQEASMSLALQVRPSKAPYLSDPTFPSDLDWSVLNDQIVYDLLTLANRTATANQEISYIAQHVSGPPFYEEALQATEERYETLKLSASRLADQLRTTWNLPQRPDEP